MAHAQKPDFVFRRSGRVHLNRRGRQFSRLLAAEVCASAVVMLDTPCSEVVWRMLATHSIRQFPLHFPSRASPCAIRFHLESTLSQHPAFRAGYLNVNFFHLCFIYLWFFQSSDSYTGSHRRINTNVRMCWVFWAELYVVMMFGRLGFFGMTVLYDIIVPFLFPSFLPNLLNYLLTYIHTYLLTYLLTY